MNPVVVTKGVADVTLQDSDPGPRNSRTTRLMLTQFAWTLRQDPSVRTFTVNIGGRQVTDASGSSTFRVDSPDFDQVRPVGAQGQPASSTRCGTVDWSPGAPPSSRR